MDQEWRDEVLSRKGFDKLGISIYRNSIKEHERFVPPENDREEQIRSCLWLVNSMAKKFMGRGIEYNDLLGAGNLGLMDAADKFDPIKHPDVKFSSYATWWIRQKMLREIYDHSRPVKLSVHVVEDYHAIINAIKEYSISPSDLKEISSKTDLSEKRITKVLEYYNARCLSFDYPLYFDNGDGNDATLVDGTPSPCENQEETFFHKEAKEQIKTLLCRLKPRDRDIIERRWGCNGYGEPQTMQVCGDAHGITKQRAEQIEKRAIVRLRFLCGVKSNVSLRSVRGIMKRRSHQKKES